MKKIITILVLIANNVIAQFGVYDPDIYVEIDQPDFPCMNDTISFALNIDEFEPDTCPGNSYWMNFDALYVEFVGSEKVIFEVPIHIFPTSGGRFMPSDSLDDLTSGWGFDMNYNGLCKDDIGYIASGDWDFNFKAKINSIYSRIDLWFYSGYDHMAVDSGCGIQGEPDGPYTIWELKCKPLEVKKNNTAENYTYFDMLGNQLQRPPTNEIYIEKNNKGVISRKYICK